MRFFHKSLVSGKSSRQCEPRVSWRINAALRIACANWKRLVVSHASTHGWLLFLSSIRVKSELVLSSESEERNTPAPRLILTWISWRTDGSSRIAGETFSTGSVCSGRCAAISAAIRALKTRPSRSELEARRLAPCTPEHAVSPQA